jgi:uncharacterized protein YbjT (DUF2867 family)
MRNWRLDVPAVLITGASGHLGRHVCRAFHARGYRVRALARDPRVLAPVSQHVDEVVRGDLTDATTLADVCSGIDVVVSCAGASMRLGNLADRRSFMAVDYRGNANVLEQARTSGVGRFIYVSLHESRRFVHSEYALAHEHFVAALAASGVPYTVVRPTGFFSFFAEVLRQARHGVGVVVGDGSRRTNPVDERDVAELCAQLTESDERDVPYGGPEIFTRREIVELAFDVLQRPPRIVHAPLWLVRALTAPLYVVNPRLHALMTFGVSVCEADVVAPAFGTRTLRSYFTEVALAERSKEDPAALVSRAPRDASDSPAALGG